MVFTQSIFWNTRPNYQRSLVDVDGNRYLDVSVNIDVYSFLVSNQDKLQVLSNRLQCPGVQQRRPSQHSSVSGDDISSD